MQLASSWLGFCKDRKEKLVLAYAFLRNVDCGILRINMLFKKRLLIIVALILAGNVTILPSYGQDSTIDNAGEMQQVEIIGQRPIKNVAGVTSGKFLAVSGSNPGSMHRGYHAAITNGIGQPAPAANSCQTDPKSGTPTQAPASKAPVILSSGSKYLNHQDYADASDLSMGLERMYRSDLPLPGGANSSTRLFGSNWSSSFDYVLDIGAVTCSGDCRIDNITFRMPDGAAYVLYLYMPPTGPGGAPGPVNGKYLYITAAAVSSNGGASQIYAEYDLVTKAITVRDHEDVYEFTVKSGSYHYEIDRIASKGNKTKYTFIRNSGNLDTITNAYGAAVRLFWTGAKVTGVIAPNQSAWTYQYDANGMLSKVTPWLPINAPPPYPSGSFYFKEALIYSSSTASVRLQDLRQ
jgi:hypothetical protein